MVNCISLVRLGMYYKWYDSYESYEPYGLSNNGLRVVQVVNCISLVALGVYYKWYDSYESYEPYGSRETMVYESYKWLSCF